MARNNISFRMDENKIFNSDIIPPTEETKYSQLRKQNTAN